jgi:hypothetical protein
MAVVVVEPKVSMALAGRVALAGAVVELVEPQVVLRAVAVVEGLIAKS